MLKPEDRKSKASFQKISEILRRWDPIGIYSMSPSAPPDEYDSYIFSIMGLLDQGPSVEKLGSALHDLAHQKMGQHTKLHHDIEVARELVEHWKQFESV